MAAIYKKELRSYFTSMTGYICMAFMLVVTLTSLFQTVTAKVKAISAGTSDWGPYAQAILGTLLFVLAIVLAVEGCKTIFGKKKAA